STALNSNLCLVDLIHQALAGTQVPADVVQLIADSSREGVNEMLKLNQYLDILIPRGGGSLIRNVLENASVPVLQTGVGNCHIYVDSSAKYPMVKDIVINAKTQRPAVCNAAETLLVAEDWAKQHLEKLCGALLDANVQLKGCSKAKAFCPAMLDAQEEDWQNEFLDLVMAVRVVTGLDEALEHIDKYGTKHTEAIISEDPENTRLFLQMVDAAAVNHNASTRFTDGFEFGFGAEIGISTQKLHARGPVGLPELTSYKYLVHGQGQIRK
ncbi:MAG: glutamate-5-semialdehyde dehydrogenase, partial [Clostridiales bacterium]